MYFAVALLWMFFQCCSAYTCTVTHNDDQATYSIPDLSSAIHGKASHCTFTWSNASDIVIANHLGLFLQPVMSSGFGTLVTSRCIGSTTFSATCEQEGRALDYMASCTTTCPPETQIKDKEMPPSWIGAIFAAIIFLLLVCLVGFLCYRKWSCGQTGGLYPAVKFQQSPQAVVDVERGN